MSTQSSEASRPLPDRPNLRHLKDQAKDLLRAGGAASLAEAQFKVAREYGFASWPKLKTYMELLGEAGELKEAIDANDLARVKEMMTRNPALHGAPLGYGKDGPLTWVAECRVPWESPSSARLETAEWMIEHGSDVHQGGDGPMMRAALYGYRVPMMELLLRHGADVNAWWHGRFPIVFAPCETVEPAALKWLLEHGADPNLVKGRLASGKGWKHEGTALDYLIGTYARSAQLAECIDVLLGVGGESRYEVPAVMELLRGRVDRLAVCVDGDAGLVARRFGELDFGTTGMRRLTLRGATLLHVAAEYGNVEAAKLLLDRGADVNGRAEVDAAGVGGQTAIFHAVTQFKDWGLGVARLLIERRADLSVRVKLPGHYEGEGEVVECTALGYAMRFPGGENGAIELLRGNGAGE